MKGKVRMLFLTTKAPAIMAGILLFATVQQSVLHLSTPTPKPDSPTAAAKSDPCPELMRQQELLLAHQQKEKEAAKKLHELSAALDRAGTERLMKKESVVQVEDPVRSARSAPSSDTALSKADTHDKMELVPSDMKVGREKHTLAGRNGCVSVAETVQHYCLRNGKSNGRQCAHKSNDCAHLFGCKVCKQNSAFQFPDDVTNCLECKPEFVFVDAGYDDCTGSCRKPLPGETVEITTTEAPNDKVHYDENNATKYEPPIIRDTMNRTTIKTCKALDHNDAVVQRWKDDNPLLVMLTTVVAQPKPEKKLLQDAAATTWAALAPDVITLIAVDAMNQTVPGPTSGVGSPIPRVLCPANDAGTPIVASLFHEAEQLAVRTGAVFAGYSNGDIAFDDTLLGVLDFIQGKLAKGLLKKKIVVVGKRLNVDSAIDNADDVIELAKTQDVMQRRTRLRNLLVKMSRKRRNRWMTNLAEDFFFYTPGTFDWETMPNYVIGRVGWDSFVTQWVLDKEDIDVIDVSKLLHAAHLTGSDGNSAGWNTEMPDKHWNYCALHHACATNAQWTPMCQECFRCKLGGLHQTTYKLSPIAPNASSGGYPYAIDRRATYVEPADATFTKSQKSLMRFGVGLKHVQRFIDDIMPTDECKEKGNNCCSIQGGQAVEYELGMRYFRVGCLCVCVCETYTVGRKRAVVSIITQSSLDCALTCKIMLAFALVAF
eukprot:m.425728 g.425728  ORF g.425728 m.425728 type:complete len:712 (-) comp21347_c0_seq3:229-2364(-)